MKNKIQLTTFLGIMLASSASNAFLCGYKDYFRINNDNVPGLYIMRANADQDLNLEVVGPTSFEIRDMHCRSGYAHVIVAKNDYNWCRLDIKDGPFVSHPIIHASCSGLAFKGADYQGFNSYTYTLNFE